MKQQEPEELYSYHFDTLDTYGESRAQLIVTDPTLPEDSASIFAVVKWLWQTLRPVSPAQAFKNELRLQLMAECERQRVQQELGIQQTSKALWPITWIVPLVVGTASLLLGVYAFWRVRRQNIGKETILAT